VFEDRVLRKIFGPKKDEVTGDWRRLYNKELYDLYSTPIIIIIFFSPMARQPLGGLGRLIFRGFTITQFFRHTTHLVGLLWTRDQLVTETST
jgi:hypothetical protein